MKLSELEAVLMALRGRYGDLEVTVLDQECAGGHIEVEPRAQKHGWPAKKRIVIIGKS